MAGKKGKKGRKYDRNRAWCKVYAISGREQINRKKRWRRTLKRQPSNQQLLGRYKQEFGEYQPS